MGHIFVDATVRAEKTAKVRFMVDTGATYSLISPELAERIGLRTTRARASARLANGQRVRLPIAAAEVKIGDRDAGATFWIGPCDQPLLGVETLEGLGLTVDPVAERLVPKRPFASRLGGLPPAKRRRGYARAS